MPVPATPRCANRTTRRREATAASTFPRPCKSIPSSIFPGSSGLIWSKGGDQRPAVIYSSRTAHEFCARVGECRISKNALRGALTNDLLDSLRGKEGFSIHFFNRVQDLHRDGDLWRLKVNAKVYGKASLAENSALCQQVRAETAAVLNINNIK